MPPSLPLSWFILGHEPLVSLAELTQLFPRVQFKRLGNSIAAAPVSLPQRFINSVGGIVKTASQLADTLNEEELFAAIEHELGTVSGKIHFGLSSYPGTHGALDAKTLQTWGLQIKKTVKANGLSVRYVDNRGAVALSSASVLNNGLVERGREFIIVRVAPQKFALAMTTAVQPFEAFSERDFGRPGRDDVSGMLPPKLAMMMINCATIPKDRTLYDPSCGSGTILTEAMLLGYTKLLGSDMSPRAVEDTKKNIDWTREKMQGARGYDSSSAAPLEYTVFEHDIQTPPKQIDPKMLGGIVSEPYMGPPLKGRETPAELERNAREIANLYTKSFHSFAAFLPKGASVVYIFPRFSQTIRTAALALPEIQKLGFKVAPLLPTELSKEPFVLYQRDNQRVGREIWKFTF